MVTFGPIAHAAAAGAGLLMVGAVRAYQLLLSPWIGNRCRHEPSCSVYAIDAIRGHGPLAGGWLAAKRIGRCHPWGTSGYDPVPLPDMNIDDNRDADGVGRRA